MEPAASSRDSHIVLLSILELLNIKFVIDSVRDIFERHTP